MTRLAGALSVPILVALTGLSYLVVAIGFRAPAPVLLLLAIVFITSTYLTVSYVAARAFLREKLLGMLFLGAASVTFGLAGLFSALVAGDFGSNFSATIFVLGALLASLLHLACAASFLLEAPSLRHSGPLATMALSGAILLIVAVAVGAAESALPAFFVPDVGMTSVGRAALVAAIATIWIASVLFKVSPSGSSVLYWYSSALILTAVGLTGVLLSNGAPEAAVAWVGRASLYLGGVFMVVSVLSAERMGDRTVNAR